MAWPGIVRLALMNAVVQHAVHDVFWRNMLNLKQLKTCFSNLKQPFVDFSMGLRQFNFNLTHICSLLALAYYSGFTPHSFTVLVYNQHISILFSATKL